MRDYGILMETDDGVRTRQWLRYPGDEEAVADWRDRGAGHLVEIVSEGRVIAAWDDRPSRAAA